MKNTVTIEEAAERLNVNKDTVRAGLISGSLPIGSAVKLSRNYSYIIPRERFEAWVSGGNAFGFQQSETVAELAENLKRIIDLMAEKDR